jgi:dihydrofolate reductase
MARLTLEISMSLDGFIAGPNRTVEQPLAGGANLVQQHLKAGLLDEMQIHLAPFLLGDGVRLFDQLGDAQLELEVTRAIHSAAVTHVRYRVVK